MDYLDLLKLTLAVQEETPLEATIADLGRALRRKRGFGLFFVQCQKVQGEEIIAAVQEQLPQKRVRVFELNRQSATLYQEMLNAYHTETFDLAFVVGVDQAVLGYEDTRRLAGWTSEEIYTTSWKGVPHLLGHLNRQREAFAENLPVKMVFLVPSFVIDYFVQRAMDFFDWRSGFFKVPESEESMQQSAKEMMGKDFEEYEHLSHEDRLARILEIKTLAKEGNLGSEDQASLLREQGRLFHADQDLFKALDCYDQALTHKPDYHEAWNNRGNALRDLGRYEEAIVSYQKVLDLQPTNCRVLILAGAILCDQLRRYSEALAMFERTLEIEPTNDKAWFNRGIVLSNLKRYEEAIVSYDQALTHKPDKHEAWNNRGLALYYLGRYEEAIVSYDQAITHKPDFYQAWSNRGNALSDLERYEEAIVSYQKVLDLQPTDCGVLILAGAILCDQLRRYSEALAMFERTLEIEPTNDAAWHNRGVALRNLERYEEAIVSYDQALTHKPDKHEAWNGRGLALSELKRYEEAIVSYDQALTHKPDFYQAWSNRGLALSNLKRYEEAIVSYDQALTHKHDALFNLGLALVHFEAKIRDGINPEAFRAAFQTLMEKHGITPENITGMEKKGADVMLTVEVPANANKAQIEADFHGSYQRQLEASQARIAQLEARLEAKDEIINEVRQGKRGVMELTDKMTHNLGNLLANMMVVAGKDIVLDSPTIQDDDLEIELSKLRLAFQMLSPKEQQILNLKIVEGLSYEEIATKLRIQGHGDYSIPSLRKLKERSLKRLRTLFHTLSIPNS